MIVKLIARAAELINCLLFSDETSRVISQKKLFDETLVPLKYNTK